MPLKTDNSLACRTADTSQPIPGPDTDCLYLPFYVLYASNDMKTQSARQSNNGNRPLLTNSARRGKRNSASQSLRLTHSRKLLTPIHPRNIIQWPLGAGVGMVALCIVAARRQGANTNFILVRIRGNMQTRAEHGRIDVEPTRDTVYMRCVPRHPTSFGKDRQ